MFLLLTLTRNFFFFWIASSDYDTISIYIVFFQTITRCCQVHAQATSLFKKISIGMFQWEAIFVTFRVWLHEKQLGPFGGDILLTRMLLICQTSFIFILCLCDQGGWRAYRYLVFRSKMWWKKNDINTSASLARRICECISTNLN